MHPSTLSPPPHLIIHHSGNKPHSVRITPHARLSADELQAPVSTCVPITLILIELINLGYLSILLLSIIFHIEWYIRQLALIFFYHILQHHYHHTTPTYLYHTHHITTITITITHKYINKLDSSNPKLNFNF